MKRNSAIILAVILILIDQLSKFWVKLNMTINQSIYVFGDWFQIRFIENPGAAFGMQLGGDYGKLSLSLFRIVLVIIGILYIIKLIRKNSKSGVIVGCVMILAGALGNIIDGVFYGVIFSQSTIFETATLFPEAGGYASWMHGHVVDMLYFPIIHGVYPDWLPYIGGEPFEFFSPIFNLADSYITLGLVYLLLFHRNIFK